MDPHQLQGYANAAKVRLQAHHASPVDFQVVSDDASALYQLAWTPIDEQLRHSYRNADDAKRDGAYVLAMAAVEEVAGMVGVARAETRTGADYYLAPLGSETGDLESAFRLEVSGTDGGPSEIRRRLHEKRQQTQRGLSTVPAIAAVVGFKTKLILIERT
ncbi:hypothetical protein CDN98_17495 [Roseateles terrae]|nr:hypothetical protein CDN98_17495 [Roseateles terrae]